MALAHHLLQFCDATQCTLTDLRDLLNVGSPILAVDDRSFLLLHCLCSDEYTPTLETHRLMETCAVDDIVDAMIQRELDATTVATVLAHFLRDATFDRKTALILSRLMTYVFPISTVLFVLKDRYGVTDSCGYMASVSRRVLSRVGASLKARQRAARLYVDTYRSVLDVSITCAAIARGGSM